MFKEIVGEAWPVIEKAAPVIAQAVGGPFAGTAMAALTILAKEFGLEKYDLLGIGPAILNTPNAEERLNALTETFSENIKNEFKIYFNEILKNHFPIKAELNVKLEWPEMDNK